MWKSIDCLLVLLVALLGSSRREEKEALLVSICGDTQALSNKCISFTEEFLRSNTYIALLRLR